MSHDRQFFDTFMLVLGALVAFTVLIYVLANYVAGRTQELWIVEDPAHRELLQRRIQPLGTVALAGAAPESPAGAPAPAETGAEMPDGGETAMVAAGGAKPEISGESVYNNACMACHMIGAAGAPKLGDIEGWAPRIAQGIDVLTSHAINGYQGAQGVMPAKGGRLDLSDEQVRAAVEYMVAQSQ